MDLGTIPTQLRFQTPHRLFLNLIIHVMTMKLETTTFRLFSRLPTELRLQIWAHALPQSFTKPEFGSTLTIRAEKVVSVSPRGRRPVKAEGIIRTPQRTRRLPIIFFVNHESRQEAARLERGTWHPLDFSNPAAQTSGPGVYISPRKESVWFVDCFPATEKWVMVWGARHAKLRVHSSFAPSSVPKTSIAHLSS
jgi:hypothetical protein